MIWQNPWAWAGLAALGIPVAIHLLGRGRAPLHRFPTLRFIDQSRLLPTRRTRIHDAWLLLLRLAILAVAVIALARPLFPTAGRQRTLDAAVVRAIIVDTSASMQRLADGGRTAAASAMERATQSAGDAATSIVLPVARVQDALPGAVGWLSHQSGRGEVVILSDFQTGTIDSLALAAIPAEFGITLQSITATSPLPPRAAQVGSIVVQAEMQSSAQGIEVTWKTAGGAPSPKVRLLTAPADAALGRSVLEAAGVIAVPLPVDTVHSVAIVAANYPGRAELLAHATVSREPWTGTILLHLARDPLWQGLPASDTTARMADVDGAPALLLFLPAGTTPFEMTSLVAAAHRSLSLAPPAGEMDPVVISDERLHRWNRPAASEGSTRSGTGGEGPSDGRWFWVIALVLLGAEALLRRSMRTAAQTADASV